MTGTSTRDGAALEGLVAQVADEFLERQKRAERPDIEEYAARYPEAADLLRKVLAALQLLGASGEAGLLGDAEGKGPAGTLGDFRILREVGRGGMGIVYEAEQISLGRRVALKVLPFAATMDPRQLQRFHNEARAAASLHHEHIAPVHGVGSERGVHYYAMQFIDGQTLAALIARQRDGGEPGDAGPYDPPVRVRPIGLAAAETMGAAAKTPTPGPKPGAEYYQSAARLGVQAAEALEHAHRLGIVHRDVKPGNLMVDGQGKLWVTDFGLARVGTDPGLTMTGDILGTLRYMAPEQALAKHGLVDHRTDVYSLGVTLYELVTLVPAIDGKDKEEVLRKIAFDEPTPPRRVNPAVPAELETVLLKAMAKEPAERYATAQELADDLRNWLEDKPIQARRPTLVQRARKWSRRHRPVVWAAAAVVLVAAGSLGWAWRDRAARAYEAELDKAAQEAEKDREIDSALRDAVGLRDRRSWFEAREAIKRLQWLLADGGRESAQKRLRAIVADLDMVARLEEIRLRPLVGRIASDEGQAAEQDYAAAFRDYGVDIDVLDPAVAAQRIRDAAISEDLLGALDDWMALQDVYLPNDSLLFPKRARAVARAKQAANPAAKPGRNFTLRAVASLADPDDWRDRLRDPVVLKDRKALEALANQPGDAATRPSTALLLARALTAKGANEKALEVLFTAQARSPADITLNLELAYRLEKCKPPRREEAVGFARVALASRPEHPAVLDRLGDLLLAAGHADQALAAYRKAIDHGRDEPDTHFGIGDALVRKGAWVEAEAAYKRAISFKPERYGHRGNKALAWVYRNTGEWDRAVAALEQAAALDALPHDIMAQLAWLLVMRPDVERRDAGRALELARTATDKKPGYGPAWNALGVASYRSNDYQGAIVALDKSCQLSGGGSAWEWLFLAMAHERLGNRPKAREWIDRADGWLKERQDWLADIPAYRDELQRLRAEAAHIEKPDGPVKNSAPTKKP